MLRIGDKVRLSYDFEMKNVKPINGKYFIVHGFASCGLAIISGVQNGHSGYLYYEDRLDHEGNVIESGRGSYDLDALADDRWRTDSSNLEPYVHYKTINKLIKKILKS